MKVLFLGAGASNGAEQRIAPPTARGFFHPGNRHVEEIACLEEYRELLEYLQRIYASASPFAVFEPRRALSLLHATLAIDIEQLFSNSTGLWRLGVHGEAGRGIRTEKYGRFDPAALLHSYLIDVLWASTKDLKARGCSRHRWLVERFLEPGDVVISFNYDLIMDTALVRHSDWSEGDGYGLKQHGDGRDQITLLKPHGSLNWYRHRKMRPVMPWPWEREDQTESGPKWEWTPFLNVQSVEQALEGATPWGPIDYPPRWAEYFKLKSPRKDSPYPLWPYLGITYEGLRDFFPYLILPGAFKSVDAMTFDTLPFLWRKAMDAVVRAKSVWACGFSFRDPHVVQLLLEARLYGGSTRELHIVDPNPKRVLEQLEVLERDPSWKVDPIESKLEHWVGG